MTAVPHARDPDDVALEWFAQLYRDVAQGWCNIFSIDGQGARHVDWTPHDHIDELAVAAIDRAADSDVWFGVATRQEQLDGNRRGGDQDCAQLTALWVDIDVAGPNHADNTGLPTSFDQAWQLARTFPLPATATVNTGGGLQAWWLLNEPADSLDAVPLLARWEATWKHKAAEHDLHIDSVFDLARVMRVPGTVNRKTVPTPVVILDADWDRRYGLDDIDQWLTEPAAPAASPQRDAYIGPQRPGDAFNVRHSGAEVLADLGFTFARRDRNGDEHWVRPGKTKREGTSATIYAEDGHITIWSDTAVTMWPHLQVRRPYDPYGLLVATKYDGDFARAAAELRARGYGSTNSSVDLAYSLTTGEDHQPLLDPQPQPSIEDFLPPDLDEFLDTDEPPYAWVIDGLAEQLDRIILTGQEGKGKSTLLRQIAVQLASGIHPFTHQPIEPVRVLYIDCENSARQLRRKLRELRAATDTYNKGNLRIHVVEEALELAQPAVYNALSLRVEAHQPHIIIIGPLYKMIDGDPVKEEPAKALATALDRLRHLHNSVLLIEAHSPYPETTRTKRPIRPYGASLWSRWPEFGLYLSPDGDIEHWRGPREERSWPAKLDRGHPWPWMPGQPTTDHPEEAYSGPTKCAAAVAEVLVAHTGQEVSGNGLIILMKAAGHAFHDKTIRAGAELAVDRGQIRSRPGPSRSRIYWHDEQEQIDDF